MRLLSGAVLFVTLLSPICCSSPPPTPPQHTTKGCPSKAIQPRTFRVITECNRTTLKTKQVEEIQAPTTRVYLPVLYLLALTVGLPANLVALWVLLFRTKRLPSTTLLIQLTISDCLLLLALPFRIVYHFRGNHWDLGEPFCRIVMAMFYGNMYGSVLCLALVALDRYIALVHPFGAKTLRTRRISLYMTAAVWMVVLAAMLPLLVSQQTYKLDSPDITTCHDALPEKVHENFFLPYFATLFSVCFVLPFLCILFCHGAVLRMLMAEGRRYNYAVRVTALVLVVFVVCLLPSNILLLLTYADKSLDENGDTAGEGLYVPYTISLAVSTFNSCIDPFIYYYVSTEFREKAKTVLCCRGDAEDKPSSLENGESSSGQRSKLTLLSKSSQRNASGKEVASL